MPVAVLIELATAEQKSPDVPALVEACDRASAETSCAIAGAGELFPAAGGALAIVVWSSDHREARVEIACVATRARSGIRGSSRSEPRTRSASAGARWAW